jgi:hypothetical protein
MGHFLPPTTNHLWWTDGATTYGGSTTFGIANHLWCSPKAMANTLYVVGGRTRTLVHQRWLPPLQTVEANTFYLVGDHLWCSPKAMTDGEERKKAAPRFELGNKGFAILCLTTWLCRHSIESQSFSCIKNYTTFIVYHIYYPIIKNRETTSKRIFINSLC